MEKIGDFAKRCEVTVQTLRWYDKLGLLTPDYIDKFTGYRYYNTEKAVEVQRITALKEIGFSLEEIKRFCFTDEDGEKHRLVLQKRRELENLAKETAQKLRILNKIEEKLDIDKKNKKREQKMKNKDNFKFENDEKVIGRWEVLGAVEKKEDYLPGKKIFRRGVFFSELYFLPDGEEYWRFAWTKNCVKVGWNDGFLFCKYETQETGGVLYMFLELHQTVVLKQMDKKRYTQNEIGWRGNIDLIDKPFVNDEKVLGKWSAVDFVNKIDDFNISKTKNTEKIYFKSAEFLPDGEFVFVMDNTAERIPGSESRYYMDSSFKSKWTNGTTFSDTTYGLIANTYEIRVLNGKEYLFIEWKTNDYVWVSRQWGNESSVFKIIYYVFTRES